MFPTSATSKYLAKNKTAQSPLESTIEFSNKQKHETSMQKQELKVKTNLSMTSTDQLKYKLKKADTGANDEYYSHSTKANKEKSSSELSVGKMYSSSRNIKEELKKGNMLEA